MMAQTEPDGGLVPPQGKAQNMVKLVLTAIGAMFFTGTAIGFLAAHEWQAAPVLRFIAIGILLVALAGLCLWQLAKALLALGKPSTEKVAPRVRKTNRLTLISAGIGGIIAIALLLGERQLGSTAVPAILSSEPIPGWLAAAILATTLTVIPWVTFTWHRNIDEFDLQAYRDGALAAIYAFSALSFCWWIGWRGGFFPQVSGLVVFFTTYSVWTAVWLWRRR